MSKKVAAEDLSVEDLRRLLVEKRRSVRLERLEHFRRTGRMVTLISDTEPANLENLHSSTLTEIDETSSQKRSRPKRYLDAVLLVIEVSAVVGLLFVLFNGLEVIRDLNKQVADALIQPTMTPTPLIVAVVLPSGHTPPNSTGGAKPNDAEIPEHLRPLVQSLASVPVPTQGPQQARRIQISAISVDAPVVLGDGWEQLKKGVGQHIGSANPGENNNVVLSAHNDVFGEIFRDLNKLNAGDQVILYTSQRAFTYIVTGSKIVEPNQVEVMASTKDPIVTLISCFPYMVDKQRIVVTARLQDGG